MVLEPAPVIPVPLPRRHVDAVLLRHMKCDQLPRASVTFRSHTAVLGVVSAVEQLLLELVLVLAL